MPHVKVAKVLTNYFCELKKAADESQGMNKIPIPKRSISQADVTPVLNLKDISDDEIPF